MHNIIKTEFALVLFADIVNSCLYSSILGPLEYAKELLRYRAEFEALANDHFPPASDNTSEFVKIETRGDEGTVFCVIPSGSSDTLIYKAIQFAFELKGRLESKRDTAMKQPHQMKVGVGIHWGEVALITKSVFDPTRGRSASQIVDISGYSINYAKRVESCSRVGRFSNVFVSKDVAYYLDGFPIVLDEHIASMKGISDREQVYEIRSAYFSQMPLNPSFKGNDLFINKFVHEVDEYSMLREPWQKGLTFSVLDTCMAGSGLGASKKLFQKKRTELAWRNPVEDDPLILFLRACQCEDEEKFTLSIKYLKELLDKYPQFVHARLKLMKVCWAIAKLPGVRLEKVVARDIADEFLQRFPHYLTGDMEYLCTEILKECSEA